MSEGTGISGPEETRYDDLIPLSALQQAAPQLRPEVDVGAAVVSLQGMLLVTVLWTLHGWMQLQPAEWDELLESAVRMLVRSPD